MLDWQIPLQRPAPASSLKRTVKIDTTEAPESDELGLSESSIQETAIAQISRLLGRPKSSELSSDFPSNAWLSSNACLECPKSRLKSMQIAADALSLCELDSQTQTHNREMKGGTACNGEVRLYRMVSSVSQPRSVLAAGVSFAQ